MTDTLSFHPNTMFFFFFLSQLIRGEDGGSDHLNWADPQRDKKDSDPGGTGGQRLFGIVRTT